MCLKKINLICLVLFYEKNAEIFYSYKMVIFGRVPICGWFVGCTLHSAQVEERGGRRDGTHPTTWRQILQLKPFSARVNKSS